MANQFKLLLSCLLVLILTGKHLNAQLVVDNTFPNNDAAFLVQNVLLGTGVTVSNITFNGNTLNQIGYFNGVNSNIGIPEGIIMASGNVNEAVGPNDNSGATGAIPGSPISTSDPDLLAILNGSTGNDAAILEFDFIATGDTVKFKYVFGSDEYPEYVNSFNDAFGFFISGPGIAGPYSGGAENIAVIPFTTTPVTIDNVNNGNDGLTGPCVNCAYYIHNGDGFSAPQNTDSTVVQCDGFTTVLEAVQPVICGSQYHIKMAICDANDGVLDSWVFLEAGSFKSNAVVMQSNITIDGSDSILYEGCGLAILDLGRSIATDSVTVYFNVTGTATEGVDFPAVPDSIVFIPGQDSGQIVLTAVADGLTEGFEYVIIELIQQVCGVSDTQSVTFFLGDYDSLIVTTTDTTMYDCVDSIQIYIDVEFYSPPHYTLWSTGDTTDTIWVSPDSTTTYLVNVRDTCDYFIINDSLTVTVLSAPDYTYVKTQTDTGICLLEQVQFLITPDTAGGFTYLWTSNQQFLDNPNIAFPTATINVSGTQVFHFTITDSYGCMKMDSFIVQVSSSLQPIITAIADTTVCLGDSSQLGVLFDLSGAPACDYTLIMFDAGGFGWFGNSIDIFINGSLQGNYFMTGGPSDTITIPAGYQDSISVTYNAGFFDFDYSYDLYDQSGALVYSTTGPPPGGNVYNGVANCAFNLDSYTYSWSPAPIVNNVSIQDPFGFPTTDTTFTVIVTDSIGGCADTSSVTVNMVPSFTFSVTPTDTAICLTEIVPLKAIVDTGTNYTYSWTPSTYLSDASVSNPVATITTGGTYVYTVIVSTPEGCSRSENVNITVGPSPPRVVTATADPDTVCTTGLIPTQLSADFTDTISLNCNYTLKMFDSWGDGWDGASITFLVNGVPVGTYDVPFTPGDSNIVTIPVAGGDALEIQYTSGAFENEHTYFLYDGTGALVFSDGPNPATGTVWTGTANCGFTPSVYIYSWTPTTGLSDPNIANPIVNVGTPTTYTVVVTDSIGGCVTSDSVQIDVQSPVTVYLFPNGAAVCVDSVMQLIGSPPNGVWSGAGIVDTTQGIFDAAVAGVGSWTIVYTAPDICQSQDSMVINVTSSSPAITISNTGPYCADNSIYTLSATPTNGTWAATGIIINSITGEINTGTVGGNFAVTYTLPGCGNPFKTDTITILQVPQTSIAGIGESCIGSADGYADLTVTSGTTPYSYSWSNGMNTEDISNLTTGQYSVTVTDSNNCTVSGSIQITTLLSTLLSAIDPIGESCTGANDGLANLLVAGGTIPYFYNWSNGAITQNIQNLAPGAYSVVVTDFQGCQITASTNIPASEEPCPLDIPNIFAPGDINPDNRVFKLFGLQANAIKEIKMYVYDRWGKRVFEATTVSAATLGWDGTRNGKISPAGVYVYYIEITMHGDNQIIRKGDVTLIR